MSTTTITVQVDNNPPVTVVIAESAKLDDILTQLANVREDIKEFRDTMQLTAQEITDLLNGIDTTTNAAAANVQTIATASAAIKTEMDAFVAAAPAGTVLTDAQVTQLQNIAVRAQAISDGSTAQVAVLQGVAAEGQPVTPPAPTPVVVPPAPAQP
jgi:uncharacterized phage infection (PIP) family protein YhgE